jgi:hypothetical protein
MGTPMWVDDPGFDVHKHVQHVTLPAPGTDASRWWRYTTSGDWWRTSGPHFAG